MAQYTPLAFEINLSPEGLIFDVGSLFDVLGTLHDQRDARGLRYSLVTVLVFTILAKLAGQDHLRGIAQWVRKRALLMAMFLALAKVQAPHATTFSRILGSAVQPEEFQAVTRRFFAQPPKAGTRVQITLDGKTMRGTIPAGHRRGVHLLAAYLPDEGWVLYQVEVGSQENEIPAAGRVVKCLDLRNKIITGDALLAQRELSLQILQAGGEYVWSIKENQPDTYQDLVRLFAPEPVVKGFSPASHDDFRTAQTVDKGHGRIERRTIIVSHALKGYLNWPGVEQVFQLERCWTRVADGHRTHEVGYGLTSLTPAEVSPQELLAIIRKHWQIENGLHYRRDDTLKEDRCTLRTGHAAEMMALINNLVLGLLARHGVTNVADARREYADDPHLALDLILNRS
jgi:predicted transposase YbfD/YdcC